MALSEQWKKIKDNWLIIVAVIALLLLMNIGGFTGSSYSKMASVSQGFGEASYDMESYAGSRGYIAPSSDFAPGVEERKITRTASMSTEVERGQFNSAQQSIKDMISASDSYLINQNVQKYGAGRKEYYQGWYDIRVDTKKYDALVSQLKGIGKVQSFSESANDVTGQYTNAEINLETEKARLQRYQEMYAEAANVGDKLNINDRIFDQERTIKYLEDYLKHIDERIEYTTIRLSLVEKRSGYANVALVKFSALVEDLVGSFNALLAFIFTILPWAVAVLIVALVWRFAKRKK